jgi:hypothetical protein
MDGRIPQMPGDMIDRNNNGTFELNEIVDPLTSNGGRCGMPASLFKTSDRNSDGAMTPAELFQDVRKPEIVYSDRMQLVLGGKRVELIHPGKNHSDDATVLLRRPWRPGEEGRRDPRPRVLRGPWCRRYRRACPRARAWPSCRRRSFEKYKDWNGYEQRRAPTIESAYNNLKIYR